MRGTHARRLRAPAWQIKQQHPEVTRYSSVPHLYRALKKSQTRSSYLEVWCGDSHYAQIVWPPPKDPQASHTSLRRSIQTRPST